MTTPETKTRQGIPSDLAELIFEKVYPKPPVQFRDISFAYVEPIVKRDVDICLDSLFTAHPRGMLLTGMYGTGKTALLYLIWAEYVRRGIQLLPGPDDLSEGTMDYYFIDNDSPDGRDAFIKYACRLFAQWFSIRMYSHWDLIGQLRTQDNGVLLDRTGPLFEPETLGGCKPVLLLDDLGRGFDDRAGWNSSLADEFFNWRWEHAMPIVATTNMDAKQLRSWPGWGRVVDRLADPSFSIPVSVGGKTKRSKEFLKRKTNGR